MKKRKGNIFLEFLSFDIFRGKKDNPVVSNQIDNLEGILRLISTCENLIVSIQNSGAQEIVSEVLLNLAKLKRAILKKMKEELFL